MTEDPGETGHEMIIKKRPELFLSASQTEIQVADRS